MVLPKAKDILFERDCMIAELESAKVPKEEAEKLAISRLKEKYREFDLPTPKIGD